MVIIMSNNKKSKNNLLEKLHLILDNRSPRKYPAYDEKYLQSLKKRIHKNSRDNGGSKEIQVQQIKQVDLDPLKPKVTIHPRKVINIEEKLKFEEKASPVEFKEKAFPDERIELSIEDEDVFEVEKSAKESPEFIEVKPSILSKEDKRSFEDDNLKEWDTVDKTESEKIDESPIEFEEIKTEPAEKVPPSVTKPVEKPKMKTISTYCHHCGAKLNGDGNFCGSCGKNLFDEGKIEQAEPQLKDQQKTEIKSIEKQEEEQMEWVAVETEKVEEKIQEEEQIPTWEPVEIEKPDIKEEIPKPKKEPEKTPSKKKPEKEEIKPKAEEKPEQIQPEPEKETQILSFKDINSIDQQTAKILYTNGITNVETLRKTSFKELTKIKGIKRKKAKQIKNEINEITPIETIIKEENKTKEKISKEEEMPTWEPIAIEEPKEKETVPTEKEKTEKKKVKEAKKKTKKTKKVGKKKVKEKELKQEPKKSEEKKDNVFKDIKSIDNKIAELLLENDIDTIEKLQSKTISELVKIKGIKRKMAKEIKKELKNISTDLELDVYNNPSSSLELQNLIEDDIEEEIDDEWEYFDEDKISEESLDDIKGYRHEDYTLYEKTVEGPTGKVRTVRFFSKGEPDGAEPIDLPKGYEVKVNKKTGVPYLRLKK